MRFSKGFGPIFVAAAAFSLALLQSGASLASGSYSLAYRFSGGNDGGNAATSLAFDAAGNAYGTAVIGGLYGCGVVFKLSPTSPTTWQESVLYNFTCGADGKNPHGGVTLDRKGDLFGTTTAGGSGGACTGDGCGVVYELTPARERVLYNFTGGNDGFGPGGGVSFDKQGRLYGTTPDGGAFSQGVVYQLSHFGGAWHFTVIHAFTGGADGAVGSLGSLLIDDLNNIYGVTELGGAHSAGTVYKLAAESGGTFDLTTLYAFKGMPDAGFAYGGLIADAGGDLFGTTYFGGAHGAGSVFELSRTAPRTWKESVLYSFTGGIDGGSPTSTLVFGPGGALLGTTSAGGNSGCSCGTVFKIKAGTNVETVLHRFGAIGDGMNPYYGLSLAPSGSYLASTVAGGPAGQGVVFEIKP
jgi:uncharacterized repeat protein (TIGR03803 family)